MNAAAAKPSDRQRRLAAAFAHLKAMYRPASYAPGIGGPFSRAEIEADRKMRAQEARP